MKKIQKYNSLIITVILLIVSLVTSAQAIPDRPNPPRLVNDFTNTLTAPQLRALEHKLVAYNDSTSTQIAVVFVNDLQGTTVADFAYQLGEKWGVGTKDNNGAVILVKPKNENGNGQVNISVGYGLEPYVPDALAKRIIEKEMIPSFKMNDYYSGVDNAVNTIIGLASGAFSADEYANDGGSALATLVIFFFIAIVITFAMMSKSDQYKNTYSSKGDNSDIWKALFWASIFSNSHRHNHHDHWGNFSGGSGGFGGGGGFGGFGGGSFGGGGASGSW